MMAVCKYIFPFRIKMLLTVLAVLTALHPLSPVAAQIFDPVKWQATVENLTATSADLKFTAIIDAGWSMYAVDIPEADIRPMPTVFTFKENPAFETEGSIEQVMKPDVKADPLFGGLQIGKFYNLAVFRQKIRITKSESIIVKTQVEYTCCNDVSCLPPKIVDLELTLHPPAQATAETAVPEATAPPVIEQVTGNPLARAAVEMPHTDSLQTKPEETASGTYTDLAAEPAAETSANTSLWTFFLLAVLAGIGGVLTPCVYPMIPLTVSFFMRDGKKRAAGIIKALIFGFSIVAIYTLAGVIVALTKRADLINAVVAHWLTNVIFAGIFIAFALSFFGLFELTLSGSLTGKIDRKADSGSCISAFFMALTLVIVSFSCTGPVVGSLLVASTQGLAIKPVLGMFGYGLAFALPFTLLAFFPALISRLPKSGSWMNAVKTVFAFLMTACALYFLSYADKGLGWNIITRDVFICIWTVIFALTGFYLLGKIRLAHDGEQHTGIMRLFAAGASFVFALYLFTGLLGAPLSAIAGLLPSPDGSRTGTYITAATVPASTQNLLCSVPKYGDHPNLSWPYGLQGYFDYDEAVACAREKNKPVLMIFKGHTCAKCREMEAVIWPDPEVLRLMSSQFILLALYTDDTSPLPESEHITSPFDGRIKKTLGQKNMDIEITRYRTNAFPYHAIISASGRDVISPMGYTSSAEEFAAWMKNGLAAF